MHLFRLFSLLNKKTNIVLGFIFSAFCIVSLAGCSSSTTTETISYTLEQRNNEVASTAIHVAALGLGAALDGITDENQRVKLIRDFIEPIRFFDDKSGYFYVYYYNCTNLAHAVDKSLPGKDLTNYQDSKGLLVIQELSKKAQSGGGYVTFWWPHPQTKEEQRKIGYVEPIPGTQYFIGTGYYPATR